MNIGNEIEYYRQRNKRAYSEGLRLDPFFEIPDRPHKKVLEISAGAGNLVAIPLAVRGHSVVATEFKLETCEFIKRYAANYGVNIKVEVLDFYSPKYPCGIYDYIFARYCLYNHLSFPHLQQTINALKEKTSEGGEHRFMMISNYRIFRNNEYHMHHTNLSSRSANDIIKALEEFYNEWIVSYRLKNVEQRESDSTERWTKIEFKALNTTRK